MADNEELKKNITYGSKYEVFELTSYFRHSNDK